MWTLNRGSKERGLPWTVCCQDPVRSSSAADRDIPDCLHHRTATT